MSGASPPQQSEAGSGLRWHEEERRRLLPTFATALNLGNPKMPSFHASLLPNVVGASLALGRVAVLAAMILAVEVAVIGGRVLIAGRVRKLRAPLIVRRVNRTAGGVMVGADVAVVATR